jgi:hypothetical protein
MLFVSRKLRRHGPVYTDLDREKRVIRLAKILPAKFNRSRLECELITVSLDDHPEYAALSYVWGDPTITTSILVNGITKVITKNLASALKEFRRRRGVYCYNNEEKALLYIWADALCINQDNVKERNHQVSLMQQVYSEATVVVSWLQEDLRHNVMGYPVKDCKHIVIAFRVIDTLWSQWKATSLSKQDEDPANPENLFEWMEPKWLSKAQSSATISQNYVWNAMFFFGCHPYFYRLWMMQEMAFARKHVFWTKSLATIDGSKVHNYVNWIKTVNNMSFTQFPHWVSHGIRTMLALQFSSHQFQWDYFMKLMKSSGSSITPERDFYLAVRETHALRVTDPRDKIFALSSISGSMPVNYDMEVKVLYCSFEQHYLEVRGHSLDFLCRSGTGFSPSNTFGLPSWTPDLSRMPQYWPAECTELYTADDNMTCPMAQITYDSILIASGSKCDTVVHIESMMAPKSDLLHSFIKNYGWPEEASHSSYPTGISRTQALVRSLVLDYSAKRGHRVDITSETDQSLLLLGIAYMLPNPSGVVNAIPIFAGEVSPNEPSTFGALLRDILPGSEISDTLDNEDMAEWLCENASRDTFDWNQSLVNFRYKAHRLFHTKEGYLGWGPGDVKVGDAVCVLRGSGMPVLLRDKETWYEHVGTCFVLGFMDGEAAVQIQEQKLKVEEFEIR